MSIAVKTLLIIGAGQYGMVAQEIATELGYERIEFLDDNSPLSVGKPDDFNDFAGDIVVSIGNPDVRAKIIKNLQKTNRLVSLISPRAYVSPSAKIAPGCIIEPMAVINTEARLGTGCFISACAVVNHNCVLEECCHIDCNATVMKASTVPTGMKVESNKFWGF